MTDEEYIKNISSISTEKLFNLLEYYGYDSYYADLLTETIEELKKRFEERPTGEWIEHYDSSDGFTWLTCSRCMFKAYEDDYNFCPNCGAEMRKGDRE